MNEFGAKKVGEVAAFARVGAETVEKAQSSFGEIFGSDQTQSILEEYQTQFSELEEIATVLGVSEIVMKKVEGTGTKLSTMRATYVGDEWDNPSEIAEWLGFFEGAAIVHWKLVSGASERTENDALKALTERALGFHKGLFEKAGLFLEEQGRMKS